jgi:Mobilization protein NikA
MLRMLLPSQSIAVAVIFFSVGSWLAISFLLWTYCATEIEWVNRIIVAQKPKPKSKPRTGRPKLPDGTARNLMVRARVSPDELDRIESAAKAAGEKTSDWVRNTLLKSA